MDRFSKSRWVQAAVLLAVGPALVAAQGTRQKANSQQPATRRTQNQAPANTATQANTAAPAAVGSAEIKRRMVNPTDPICVINGEVITRQQLADECVARRGEEILDSLIARKLIEQALKTQKMEVTASEVEAEIDRIALTLARTDRETWLRSLAKDRNISPAQYARDIIFPALALKKLAKPRVQVTDVDIKDAFESEYGEKLIYRMIVTDTLSKANAMYTELQKNPGGFEYMARNDPRSIDPTTKPDGGKPMEPMRRHSYPREATDRVFTQLVDGDAEDKDPTHKPTDGKISGPIQIAEAAWILVKREGLIQGEPYNTSDPARLEAMKAAIVESKLNQHMELVMGELVQAAAIENHLKGTVKTANKDIPAAPVDQEIKLMGQKADEARARNASSKAGAGAEAAGGVTATQAAAAAAASAKRASVRPPGVAEQDLEIRSQLEKSGDTPPPVYDPSKDPELPPANQPKK
jgi:foldase protein PrsA